MSESRATAGADLHSTDVRFGLRAMLIVMLVVAVFASAAGGFLRLVAADGRSRVAVAWVIWLAVVALCIAVSAATRIRFEKRAGRTLMRLAIYGGSAKWRVFNQYALCGTLVFFGFIGFSFATASAMSTQTTRGAVGNDLLPFAMCAAYGVALAILTGYSISLWWWGRDIRLCEAGVLWDRRIIAWADVHERWDPDRDTLTIAGHDQHKRRLVCAVLVPDERREAVLALLQYQIPLLQDKFKQRKGNRVASEHNSAGCVAKID